MTNILVIIPARGGSKGIPRKNLRSLNDKPLIYYSINTAKNLQLDASVDVYVSSEDEEILTLSQKFGAGIIRRNPVLSGDLVTLDDVIVEGYNKVKGNKDYDLVVTMQPTSPLLKSYSLESAIRKMIEQKETETLISVTSDAHLSWSLANGKFVPNYEKRLNRQELPKQYKETGGFLISRSSLLEEGKRIGKEVDVFELQGPESIDIDTYSDWNICEYYLKRKKILFVLSGYQEIGMGHVYNVLSLANEILNHELVFLTDDKSQLAYEKIAENNYNVVMQRSADIVDDISALRPDIIINDRLDTSEAYMLALKQITDKIINFEDLGTGAAHASMVFNAMYPEKTALAGHFYGLDYFILRDEFLYAKEHVVPQEIKNVLLCFGGVDPNNFTKRVLQLLTDNFSEQLSIRVIVGLGYLEVDALKKAFPHIAIVQNVSNISEYMSEADLIFTSAGRTTFEIASIGTPTIVLCQNERETTHFFAWDNNGFKNLGLGESVSDERILETINACQDSELRLQMSNTLKKSNLKKGKSNVIVNLRKIIDA